MTQPKNQQGPSAEDALMVAYTMFQEDFKGIEQTPPEQYPQILEGWVKQNPEKAQQVMEAIKNGAVEQLAAQQQQAQTQAFKKGGYLSKLKDKNKKMASCGCGCKTKMMEKGGSMKCSCCGKSHGGGAVAKKAEGGLLIPKFAAPASSLNEVVYIQGQPYTRSNGVLIRMAGVTKQTPLWSPDLKAAAAKKDYQAEGAQLQNMMQSNFGRVVFPFQANKGPVANTLTTQPKAQAQAQASTQTKVQPKAQAPATKPAAPQQKTATPTNQGKNPKGSKENPVKEGAGKETNLYNYWLNNKGTVGDWASFRGKQGGLSNADYLAQLKLEGLKQQAKFVPGNFEVGPPPTNETYTNYYTGQVGKFKSGGRVKVTNQTPIPGGKKGKPVILAASGGKTKFTPAQNDSIARYNSQPGRTQGEGVMVDKSGKELKSKQDVLNAARKEGLKNAPAAKKPIKKAATGTTLNEVTVKGKQPDWKKDSTDIASKVSKVEGLRAAGKGTFAQGEKDDAANTINKARKKYPSKKNYLDQSSSKL